MSLNSTINRKQYLGDNSTPDYDFNFKIFSKSDLSVKIFDVSGVRSDLVLDTDYTIPDSAVGAKNGGTLTLLAGNLATGYILVITRERELSQKTDIRNKGGFYPEVHEDFFDHVIMIAQQLAEKSGRSFKLPENITSSDFNIEVPDPTSEAGKALIVSAGGDEFVFGPTASEITAAAASATAASGSASAAAASAAAAAASAAAISSALWNTHAITEGQSATDLTDESFDRTVYSSCMYVAEIIRGTTVQATGRFAIHDLNGTPRVVVGGFETTKSFGVDFSVTLAVDTVQLRAAVQSDGDGDGYIKLSKTLVPVAP